MFWVTTIHFASEGPANGLPIVDADTVADGILGDGIFNVFEEVSHYRLIIE